ncbi:PLP-dependent transferase, partial [Aquamicrobium sp.]|uniref:PLP-dependent transferase n=1 Tax=Aquamicrobium sp. TaxID=1872579 RepID=UPI00258A8F9A
MPRSGPSQTSLLHAGRPKTGWVNTPVSRASTYIFETMEDLHDARARRDSERVASYGARGTDSTMALEELVETLEGGFRSHLFPTGQAAIAVVLAGFLSAGDHILLSDAVYEPVRRFVTHELTRLGIGHTIYSPDGSDIAEKVRDN